MSAQTHEVGRSFRFGDCEVRPVERRLTTNGQPVQIGARAFDLLVALIERRERVVTKDELLDVVWPGLVVEENNLQVQVSTLRKHLGPRAIATIPGRGYRFAMTLDGGPAPLLEAALPAPASRSSNLPAATEALVGRERDAAALARLIESQRLVTVLGAGGIGKTRLAKEVARGRGERHADGVWWVDLAGVSTSDAIAPAIASAANVRLAGGDAVALLAQALGSREVLLVLDNCEHMVRDVGRIVAAMLAAGPAVRVLATSQAALKLDGECLYRLDPLAVPAADGDMGEARSFSAIQLLERRARAIDRRFELGDAVLPAAVELCRHLDGLPLAIEMAAARVPLLGIETLNSLLGERLRVLRSAKGDTAPRYETLRATLDWSHSLLDPGEQAVLRRLAAFAGTFRLDMAQQVAADADLDEWTVLEKLASLVERSLVQVQSVDPPRYRLLETTRLYALERLAEHGEEPMVAERHGKAMAALADEVTRAFREKPENLCARRYLADYDDLTLAFGRACVSKASDIAAWTGEALTRLDLTRGVYSSMLARKTAAHSLLPGPSPEVHARLWTCIAFSRYTAFPPAPKLVAAREEVAAWRRVGDRQHLHDALSRYATAYGSAGDFAAAAAAVAEARALEDPAWPPQVRLVLANNAATVAAYDDDPENYARLTRIQEELARQAGSHRLEMVSKDYFLEAALNTGRVQEALQLGRELLTLLGAHDNSLVRAISSANICHAHLLAGDTEAVSAVARQALPIALGSGVAGWLFDPLALYAARLGRHDAAARLLGFADARYAAIEEIRRLHDRRSAAETEALVAKAIGAGELERLRAEGAAMGSDQAAALAAEVLDRKI